MKKAVIGLRIKYLRIALLVDVIAMLGLIFPYVATNQTSLGGFRLAQELLSGNATSKASFLVIALAVLSVLTVLLGICSNVTSSKIVTRIWVVLAAAETFCFTVLLFASKAILDASGLLEGKFMVKDFGAGFWIGLIAAYVFLATVMKGAKIHTGYIVLVILSVIWIFPIVWIILTSLRGEGGYYVGYFIPKNFTITNYTKLLSKGSVIPFAKWWTNTFIVAACSCVLCSLIILMTSFTLSRTRFQGRKKLMQVMLIIGMFPGFMSMIAVYNILKGLGMAQSLAALVVVSAAGAAMGYYICKGFFDTIPKSLDEAAIIDGATKWQIFTRVTIPLSKPIIIYTILTSFIAPWTDYIFPSMLLGDKQSSYTVAIGLNWMTDFRRIDDYYTQFAAGALMVSVPIVILFICLQKYYVEGMSGAVKG